MLPVSENLGRRQQRSPGYKKTIGLLLHKETLCGSNRMSGKRRHRRLLYPSWNVPNPTSTSAILAVLIWASLSKSSLGQDSFRKLNVPASVSVQQGLCVHIPCNFTYNAWAGSSSGQHHGYWFHKKEGYEHHFATDLDLPTSGILMATNDQKEKLQTTVERRFRFTGHPEKGNCSFSILNAQLEDTGEYDYYQPVDNTLSFYFKPLQIHGTLQVVVTDFTEKPKIIIPSAVISGKEAVVTCTTPGPCAGAKPKIRWEIKLIAYRISPWSYQHPNGSWTYGSKLTFTPSLKDQGEPLTCRVQYPDIQKGIENTIFLVVAEMKHTESLSSSVILFVTVLCLTKILVCLLFFFSLLWFLNRRKAPCRGK